MLFRRAHLIWLLLAAPSAAAACGAVSVAAEVQATARAGRSSWRTDGMPDWAGFGSRRRPAPRWPNGRETTSASPCSIASQTAGAGSSSISSTSKAGRSRSILLCAVSPASGPSRRPGDARLSGWTRKRPRGRPERAFGAPRAPSCGRRTSLGSPKRTVALCWWRASCGGLAAAARKSILISPAARDSPSWSRGRPSPNFAAPALT